MNNLLLALQKSVHDQVGHKVDVHYQEGMGALVVPHGYPLHPNYVIFAVPDFAIRMGMTQF